MVKWCQIISKIQLIRVLNCKTNVGEPFKLVFQAFFWMVRYFEIFHDFPQIQNGAR